VHGRAEFSLNEKSMSSLLSARNARPRTLVITLLALAVMATAAATLLFPRTGEAAPTAANVATITTSERFAASQYNISFANGDLPVGGTIKIVFPVGPSLPDADIVGISVGAQSLDIPAVTTPATRTLVIATPAALGAVPASGSVNVVIGLGAIRNPGSLPHGHADADRGAQQRCGRADGQQPHTITSTGPAAIQVDDDLLVAGSAFATI